MDNSPAGSRVETEAEEELLLQDDTLDDSARSATQIASGSSQTPPVLFKQRKPATRSTSKPISGRATRGKKGTGNS